MLYYAYRIKFFILRNKLLLKVKIYFLPHAKFMTRNNFNNETYFLSLFLNMVGIFSKSTIYFISTYYMFYMSEDKGNVKNCKNRENFRWPFGNIQPISRSDIHSSSFARKYINDLQNRCCLMFLVKLLWLCKWFLLCLQDYSSIHLLSWKSVYAKFYEDNWGKWNWKKIPVKISVM